MARARRRTPGQFGLVDLRRELRLGPGRKPLLAGHVRAGRGLGAAGAQATVDGSHAFRACADAHAKPGVKHVARHSTPGSISSVRTPAVWCSCSINWHAPGWSTVSSVAEALVLSVDASAMTRTVPIPSSTAHTPPASYGP